MVAADTAQRGGGLTVKVEEPRSCSSRRQWNISSTVANHCPREATAHVASSTSPAPCRASLASRGGLCLAPCSSEVAVVNTSRLFTTGALSAGGGERRETQATPEKGSLQNDLDIREDLCSNWKIHVSKKKKVRYRS